MKASEIIGIVLDMMDAGAVEAVHAQTCAELMVVVFASLKAQTETIELDIDATKKMQFFDEIAGRFECAE